MKYRIVIAVMQNGSEVITAQRKLAWYSRWAGYCGTLTYTESSVRSWRNDHGSRPYVFNDTVEAASIIDKDIERRNVLDGYRLADVRHVEYPPVGQNPPPHYPKPVAPPKKP